MENKIRTILREGTGMRKDAEITDDMSITDDLGADSLDFIEIIMAVEEEFEVDIPDDKADSIKTVGQMIETVRTLIA